MGRICGAAGLCTLSDQARGSPHQWRPTPELRSDTGFWNWHRPRRSRVQSPKAGPLRHQSQAQVVAALRMTGYERSPRAPPQVGRVSQSSSRNSGRPWAHWVAGSLQKAVTRSGRREEMCRVWSGEGRGAASTSGHHSPHISAPSPTWKLPEPRPLHCPGSFLTQVRLTISRW